MHECAAKHLHAQAERAAVGVIPQRFTELDVLREDERVRVAKAYDATLRREILLKSIQVDGADSLRDRVVAATQAMAKVSHSSIANVYGVHAEPSTVVLMMELIPGEPLSMWRQRQRWDWRESVRLLLAAGEGLVAAHGRGVVHGGLHPGNIFVEDGRAWVTDVGISTRRDEETLAYLAPELRLGAAADERSDQYSFCVILSELLSGASSDPRSKLPAQFRQTRVPRAVAVALGRGLSPAPADRFPTMAELLAVLGKSLARLRGAQQAVIVALPLAICSAGGAWVWQVEQGSRCAGADEQIAEVWRPEVLERMRAAMHETALSYAGETFTRVQETLDTYALAWTQQHQEACEATAVHEQQSDEVLDLRMSCLQRARVGLGAAVELLQRADAEVVEHAVELTANLPALSRCADIEALRMQVAPPADSESVRRVELGRSELAQASVLEITGKYAEALERVVAARAAVEGISYEPVQAEIFYQGGVLLDHLARYDEAEDALVRALETAVASGLDSLAAQAAGRAAFVIAVRRARSQEAWRPAMLGRHFAAGLEGQLPIRGEVENHVGVVLGVLDRFAESAEIMRGAVALREEGLGPAHPLVAMSRHNLGVMLLFGGHAVEAEKPAREALASTIESRGEGHPQVAVGYTLVAMCLREQGRYAEAEEMLRNAVAIREVAFPPEHPHVASGYSDLGSVLMRQGQYEAAAAEFERALSLLLTHHPDDEYNGYVLDNLALTHLRQHRPVAAEQGFRKVIAFRRRLLPMSSFVHAESHLHLGQALAAQGRLVEARAELEGALAHSAKTLGTAHTGTAAVATALGQVLFALGEAKAAREQLEHAWTVYSQQPVASELRAEAALALARALTKADRARARELAAKAVADFEAAGTLWQTQAREARQWLVKHT